MKKNFREYGIEELNKILNDLIEEDRNRRFNKVLGSAENNPLRKRTIKREVAAIKTILNEYKLGISKPVATK